MRLTRAQLAGLALLFPLLAAAQVDTAWTRRYNNATVNRDDWAVAVATDNSNNVIVTGSSDSGFTHKDIVTIKYGPDGTLKWRRRYSGSQSGPDDDIAVGLAVDRQGSAYVTGYSRDSLLGLGYDYVTIKYDSLGNPAWVKRYDGPTHLDDRPVGIALDPTGAPVVSGSSAGSAGVRGYLTIKYNPATGDTLWVRRYNDSTGTSIEAMAMSVDDQGDVIVTGAISPVMGHSGTDIGTVKYRSNGDFNWFRRYGFGGNMNSVDYPTAMVTDLNANRWIYIVGAVTTTGYGKNFLTLVYTPDGTFRRAMNYGGNYDDEARAVRVDAAGNIYVTGSSTGTVQDILTVKYSPTDSLPLWNQRYNGPSSGDDVPSALVLDPASNVYVTGSSRGSGSNDYVTLKYNTAGTQQWVARYDGPDRNDDVALGMALDGNRSVLVTGRSYSTAGAYDMLTLKYYSRDVGMWSIVSPPAIVDSGTTVVPSCTVYNYGTTTETYPVSMRIGSFYNQSVMVTGNPPGAKVYLTFPGYAQWPRGFWPVVCSTALSGDMNPANDIPTGMTKLLQVRVYDVQPTVILNPPATVDSGTSVQPRVTVRNNGTQTVTLPVSFSISDGYNQTVSCGIAAGAESTVTFPGWPARRTGTWTMRCSTGLSNDANRGNDRITGTVEVVWHDVAAREVKCPNGGYPPGPLTPSATLRNNGTSRDPLTATFAINSSPPYTATLNLGAGLPRGVDTIVSFPVWNALTGRYTASCSVYAAQDYERGNDTARALVAIGTNDIGVVSIIRPIGSIMPGAVVPGARYRNYGSFAVGFVTRFELRRQGTLFWADEESVATLNPGTELTVEFDTALIDTGTFITKAKCIAWGDSHPQNDSMVNEIRSYWPPPGWIARADMPAGARNKSVKDGGALSLGPDRLLYAFKGGGTCEFYSYNAADNQWTTRESIPAVGSSGRKKPVKKGGALSGDSLGRGVHAIKGNSTLEFWFYDCDSHRWQQRGDVPVGTAIKSGSALARVDSGASRLLYLLKGSGSLEFVLYYCNSGVWSQCREAPAGASGKPFKDGSALTAARNKVYALKANYNEFFVYDPPTDLWTTLAPLPLSGSSGRKKKVKAGGSLTAIGGAIYCLKGGNASEFWSYDCDSNRWTQQADMPLGTGRRVKGGAGLSALESRVYGLKGNNTREFYSYGSYGPAGFGPAAGWSAVQTTAARPSGGAQLEVAPNPLARMARVDYALPQAGPVTVRLYDLTGALRRTLVDRWQNAGRHTLSLARSGLAPGVYVIRLKTRDGCLSHRLVIN